MSGLPTRRPRRSDDHVAAVDLERALYQVHSSDFAWKRNLDDRYDPIFHRQERLGVCFTISPSHQVPDERARDGGVTVEPGAFGFIGLFLRGAQDALHEALPAHHDTDSSEIGSLNMDSSNPFGTPIRCCPCADPRVLFPPPLVAISHPHGHRTPYPTIPP